MYWSISILKFKSHRRGDISRFSSELFDSLNILSSNKLSASPLILHPLWWRILLLLLLNYVNVGVQSRILWLVRLFNKSIWDLILALPFLFLEIDVFFTIIVIALTWKPLDFNQLQPILLLLHQSLWEYFLAMALDVAVEDGLLEFRHSFPSLCGDI